MSDMLKLAEAINRLAAAIEGQSDNRRKVQEPQKSTDTEQSETETPVPKTRKAKAEKAKAEKPAAKAKEADPLDEDEEVTKEDVKAILSAVNDRDSVVEILGHHGAKTLKELDPKKYAAVVEEAKAYLANAEPTDPDEDDD